jgi:hypothetical protein
MNDAMLREIDAQMVRLRTDLTSALLWLVSAPLYALGWLAGFLVRCLLWMVAALVAGYKAGRG